MSKKKKEKKSLLYESLFPKQAVSRNIYPVNTIQWIIRNLRVESVNVGGQVYVVLELR